MRPTLDKARVEDVLAQLTDQLGGDWLLIGGALVACWLDGRRTTEDLDLVGLRGVAEERLNLMELAERSGLPIEAVNSAADFFVRKVPDWRQQLEPLRKGPLGVVYRPTPTLFVLLKLRRLSSTDLADCLTLLEHAALHRLPVDAARLVTALDALPPTEDPAKRERQALLKRVLATGSSS